LPALQVPLEAKTRKVHASSQVLAGGELQLTVAQGSPEHRPPLQPN
jgi:hypothetical protein